MQALIVLGDNDVSGGRSIEVWQSYRPPKVHDRHRLSPNVGHSFDAGICLRHTRERRSLHNLPDLEDINPIDFRLSQVKEQQLHSIGPGQPRPCIHFFH